MEYCEKGSLLKFLQSSEADELVFDDLLQMAVTTASTVAHLHENNIIHRDIAARNFLMTDLRHVKMGDFGMSKTEHIYYADSDSPMPVRWR
jgi:serine/threonine protein kinase